MKTVSKYTDLKVTWSDDKERWVLDRRIIGMKPLRSMFATKAEAQSEAKRSFELWQNQGIEAHDAPDQMPEITVEECFDIFIDQSLKNAQNPDRKFGFASYNNDKNHTNVLKTLSINGLLFKDMPLTSVSKEVLEELWPVIRARGAFRSADDCWQRLSRAFALAFKRRYIAGNPCDLVERDRPDDTKERIKSVISKCAKVNFTTLKQIVDATPAEDKLKIIFAARSGLRQAEQIALKVYKASKPLEGGIDFDKGKIYIRRAMKKGLKRSERFIGDPKTVESIRTVSIDPDLAEQLKVYWQALPSRMKGEGLLFPSRDGTPLDGTNLRIRVLYRACKAAGLPRDEWPSWHDLRHAFASNYLNKEKDIMRVKELMGHADVRTTMIYTHVIDNPEQEDKDAAIMAAAMPFDLDGPNVAQDNVVKFKKVS